MYGMTSEELDPNLFGEDIHYKRCPYGKYAPDDDCCRNGEKKACKESYIDPFNRYERICIPLNQYFTRTAEERRTHYLDRFFEKDE